MTDFHSLGIEKIDDEHERIFYTLSLCRTLERQNEVIQYMKDLEYFCYSHGKSEEELLDRHDYPELIEHREAHEALTDCIHSLTGNFEKSDFSTRDKTVDHMARLMAAHQKEYDNDAAVYLKGKGVR